MTFCNANRICKNLFFLSMAVCWLSSAGAALADQAYTIGTQDVLKVEIWDEKELSGMYTISERGTIQRGWLPEIAVVGLTLDEANQAIVKALREFIKEPRVEVDLGEQSSKLTISRAVIVTGAVNRMGAFPHREGYTTLNAIHDAQGFSKFAAPNRGRIVRGQGKDKQTISVPLGDVVNRGDTSKDVVLQPGDVLVVPEGGIL